jgi:hypothetical protein
MSKFIINSGFFDSKKDLEVYKLIDCNDGSIFYVKNLPIGYKYFKCKINSEIRCLHLDSKIYGSETDVIGDVKPLKSCKECINLPPTPSVTPTPTLSNFI